MENRIASCTSCGIEFYDSMEAAALCSRCHRYKREKAEKITRLTAKNRKQCANGSFHIGFAMIDLHWRNGLSISECAKILGITEADAQFERDIVIQNAH